LGSRFEFLAGGAFERPTSSIPEAHPREHLKQRSEPVLRVVGRAPHCSATPTPRLPRSRLLNNSEGQRQTALSLVPWGPTRDLGPLHQLGDGQAVSAQDIANQLPTLVPPVRVPAERCRPFKMHRFAAKYDGRADRPGRPVQDLSRRCESSLPRSATVFTLSAFGWTGTKGTAKLLFPQRFCVCL
jgi:hypothetical protein